MSILLAVYLTGFACSIAMCWLDSWANGIGWQDVLVCATWPVSLPIALVTIWWELHR